MLSFIDSCGHGELHCPPSLLRNFIAELRGTCFAPGYECIIDTETVKVDVRTVHVDVETVHLIYSPLIC